LGEGRQSSREPFDANTPKVCKDACLLLQFGDLYKMLIYRGGYSNARLVSLYENLFDRLLLAKNQWLKWFCEAGGGAHLTKPGWSKPHTHSNPTNLGIK